MTDKQAISKYIDEASRTILFNFADMDAMAEKMRPQCPDGIALVGSDSLRNTEDRDVIQGLLERNSRAMYVTYETPLPMTLPKDRLIIIEQADNRIYDILKTDIFVCFHDAEMSFSAMMLKRLWHNASPRECYPKPAYQMIGDAWDSADKDSWAYCYGEGIRQLKNFEELYRFVFKDILDADTLNSLIASEKTGLDKFYELIGLMIDNSAFRKLWTESIRHSLDYKTSKAYRERTAYKQTNYCHGFLSAITGGKNE